MFRRSALAVAVLALLAFAGCGDDGGGVTDADASGIDAAPIVCDVVAPTECPDPMPVYADVAPVIEERCYECHDGTGDNWPLTTYPHVAAWYAEIRGAMLDCLMPPAEAEIPMTNAERELILAWIRCGFPED